MGVVEILPDLLELEVGSRTLVGGAGSALATLNDASDATYIQPAGTLADNYYARFRFGVPSIPAGAMITGVQLKYRYSHWARTFTAHEFIHGSEIWMGRQSGGVHNVLDGWTSENPYYYGNFASTSPIDFIGAFQKRTNTGRVFGDMFLGEVSSRFYASVLCTRVWPFNLARIYRLSLLVHYNERPVVNILAPTGTITLARPQITWSYFDPEGDPQNWFDLRIYEKATADLADFDGDTGESHDVTEGNLKYLPLYHAYGRSAATQHKVTRGFAQDGIEYSAILLAVGPIIHDYETTWKWEENSPNSLRDRQDFIMDLETPLMPDLTAVHDSVRHCIDVNVMGTDNMLDWNTSSLELTTTVGWTAGANTTIANTAAQALHGTRSLQLTRTTSVGTASALAAGSPVVGGQAYSAQASFRTAVTARQCQVAIAYFNSLGSLVGASTSSHDVALDSTTGWRTAYAWGVAPATAVTAVVTVNVLSAAVSEVHYVDQVGLFDGTRNNLLTDNQSSLESGTTGWAGGTNTTLAQTILGEDAYDRNAVLRMTRTTSIGTGQAVTPSGTSGFPVLASTQYTASAQFRAPVTARTCTITIAWYTAAGASISSSTSSGVVNNTTGWVTASVTATSPGTAAFAQITVDVASMAINEQQYVDGIGIWPAATAQGLHAWNRGGWLYDEADMHIMELQRSLDDGVTWETLPEQRVDHVPRHQLLHYCDVEIASAGDVMYRARIEAPNEFGDFMNSGWSKMVTATMTLYTSYWLRDPLDSTGDSNMAIRVTSFQKDFPVPGEIGYPLESNASIFSSLGVKQPTLDVEVDLLDETAYTKFFALIESGAVLLLQDVLGNQYYVRPVRIQAERMRAYKLPAEPWPVRHAHHVTVQFVSVERGILFATSHPGTHA